MYDDISYPPCKENDGEGVFVKRNVWYHSYIHCVSNAREILKFFTLTRKRNSCNHPSYRKMDIDLCKGNSDIRCLNYMLTILLTKYIPVKYTREKYYLKISLTVSLLNLFLVLKIKPAFCRWLNFRNVERQMQEFVCTLWKRF